VQQEDRYGSDVLAGDWRRAGRPVVPEATVELGLVLETAVDGWVGAVVSWDKSGLHLEDRLGRVRVFPIGTGFLVDGREVRPVLPVAAPKVWGDDLRVEGVVVERLDGVDRLPAFLDEFRPGPGRRVGVLVDHLVPGSKESRIAESVGRSGHARHALVLGHPFIDVWQSVTPRALGIPAWPTIPRGIEWKHGVCDAFGWPHAEQADIAQAWRRILGRVRSYADLEPALLGRVEELIDFVTAEPE